MPAQKRRVGKPQDSLLPAKRRQPKRACTQKPRAQGEKADEAIKTTRKPKPWTRSSVTPKTKEPRRASSATRLQKHQVDNDSDSDDSQQLERVPLTRKNVSLFNDIVEGKDRPATLVSIPDSRTQKTHSTTMSDFAQKADANGILDPFDSKPPTNLESILRRHAMPRRSAPPTERSFRRYVQRVGRAENEAAVAVGVSRHMLKEHDGNYGQAFNKLVTGIPADVGFNNGLPALKPDYVEGLQVQEFKPFPVGEHIEGAVLYKNNPGSLALPHFAGEFKKPGGDLVQASMQSRYDGAALVHGRNQALAYLGKSDPPGHAEITTVATDGCNVNYYAHYSAPAEDGSTGVKYHQYKYAWANVLDAHQEHNDGRKGIRNAQDHAEEKSYELSEQLKEHWEQQQRDGTEGASLPVQDVISEPKRRGRGRR